MKRDLFNGLVVQVLSKCVRQTLCDEPMTYRSRVAIVVEQILVEVLSEIVLILVE